MKNHLLMIPFCLALALPAHAQGDDKPTSQKSVAATKTIDNDKAIAEIDKFIKGKGKPSKEDDWRQHLTKPPMLDFDKKSEYLWHVKTNKGDITIRLMPEVAPMHVSSTIYLARLGFYDDIAFHRVIQGFMAQGGCPLGVGRGGPGYKYDGEFDPDVKHDRPGLLSMANTGRPTTDGSQFFLTFVPTPHLDGKHTIFGEVIGDGMKTVRALEKSGSRSGQTSEPLTMKKTWITVEQKAGAAKDKDADKKAGKTDKKN